MSIFQEITEEKTEHERQLMFRHPWFNVMYNWLIAILLVALGISLIAWGLDIRTRKQAASMTATALASYQAEQKAAEDARLQAIAAQEATEEYSLDKMATALAKVLYGADRFREKYGYSDADFVTLCRCVTNRVENKAYSDDIYQVIDQKDQWVGYYETNPVLDYYYRIAYDFLKGWMHETIKPIGNDYLWAEFTPNGIFLKNDFRADGYARRWRA